MLPIVLIPIGGIRPAVVDFLSLSLPEIINRPCRVIKEKIGIESFYSVERQQYHSTEILRQLLAAAEMLDAHVLGVVDKDLYIPILTFVFGEAQLGGRCALVSCHRLHQSFYGLPDDDTLFLNRCEKEAVHELGHTMGLTHCANFECVMHYSSSVADIDIKRNVFCPRCSQILGFRPLW